MSNMSAVSSILTRLLSINQVLGLSIFLFALVYSGAWSYAAWERRRFSIWAQDRGCKAASALPKPLFASLRHKINLLSHQGGDLLDNVFAEKYHKHGATHVLLDLFGQTRVIHTIDPANLQAVLSTCFTDWKPADSRTGTLYPLVQDGLLTTDGHTWLRNRKLVRRHLSVKAAKDVKKSEGDIQRLFEAIGPVDERGWTDTVDLLDLFHRLALDMSTTYLLGTSADSQAKGILLKQKQAAMRKFGLLEPKRSNTSLTYEEAYETVRDYFSWRSKLGSKFWLADGFEYRKACNTLNAFADDLIKRAIVDSKNSKVSSDKFGFIDSLVREIGDPIQIRSLAMDLFIAGQNMTGTMAAWVFAQLEAHPDIFQQVRHEILEKFGTEQEPRLDMTWDNFCACNTMQACINETLRMYPLVANIGRNAKRDTVLPHGGGPDGSSPIAVPAGAALTANLYLMHRREEDWGADAWEWKPERWTNRKFGPEYAPFGGGPRYCIGRQLSLTEVSLLIARMLQRFSAIEAPAGQDNLTKGYRAIVAPKNGVRVRLQMAK